MTPQTPYATGVKREYAVRDDLLAAGWVLVMRAAGSHGPADLAMVHPQHGLALIQVGAPNKDIGPDAREKLTRLADLCSALPLIATPIPYKPIRYRVVTRTPAQSWPIFDPIHGMDPRR
jgi:hypothetical protein